MSQLDSMFDTLRGWPDSSALSWEFKEKSGVSPEIAEGTIVHVVSDGGASSVERHTSAFHTSGNLDNPWVVIRGKNQEDSEFTRSLTCVKLRSGIVFKVATSESMAVANPVYADDGVITKTDPGSAPAIGRVIEVDPNGAWVAIES